MKTENIREWYMDKFPEDQDGQFICEDATFEGAMENINDIYDYVGIMDSMAREDIFQELAKRNNVPYSVIYDKWLGFNSLQK